MFNFFYRWHQKIGVLIAIPVLAWCLSGLTHPLMSHFFKITPAKRFLVPKAIQADSTTWELQEVLQKNGIDRFYNFRFVQHQENTYYQVFKKHNAIPVYIDIQTGQIAENFDEQYAEFLARYFIGEPNVQILDIEHITKFNTNYKRINRLLPVYKVSFDKDHGIDVYVETSSSRLGTINTQGRRVFLWLFSQLHNWDFLEGYWKYWVMAIVSLLTFFVGIAGIVVYGIFWNRLKQHKKTKVKRNIRWWHRQLGIWTALAILGFSFSGGYHALAKLAPDNRQAFYADSVFKTQNLKGSVLKHLQNAQNPVSNISIVQMNKGAFYQVSYVDKNTPIAYFDIKTGKKLEQGNERYAKYLSGKFTGLDSSKIIQTALIKNFGGEYGFINKRLPVVKITYNTPDHKTQYIETSTGKLAADITTAKRREALSFLVLHKYHSLSFMGKQWRDLIMTFAALGVFAITALGLVLYILKKKN